MNINRLSGALLVLSLLSACHGSTAEPVGPEPGMSPRAAQIVAPRPRASFPPPNAPRIDACAEDTDCVANTPPAADGCCNEPTRLVPQSHSYRAWLSTWRQANCADVSCPPPPPPARPAACALAVRCVEGTCRNTCDRAR